MRRMLDPKTIGGGGGGGGSQRHAYTVIGGYSMRYDIYTTKDYDFPIGVKTAVSDFWTNDNYKELRIVNLYPAYGHTSGGGKDIVVSRIEITNADNFACTMTGYDSISKSTESVNVSLNLAMGSPSIVKRC